MRRSVTESSEAPTPSPFVDIAQLYVGVALLLLGILLLGFTIQSLMAL